MGLIPTALQDKTITFRSPALNVAEVGCMVMFGRAIIVAIKMQTLTGISYSYWYKIPLKGYSVSTQIKQYMYSYILSDTLSPQTTC